MILPIWDFCWLQEMNGLKIFPLGTLCIEHRWTKSPWFYLTSPIPQRSCAPCESLSQHHSEAGSAETELRAEQQLWIVTSKHWYELDPWKWFFHHGLCCIRKWEPSQVLKKRKRRSLRVWKNQYNLKINKKTIPWNYDTLLTWGLRPCEQGGGKGVCQQHTGSWVPENEWKSLKNSWQANHAQGLSRLKSSSAAADAQGEAQSLHRAVGVSRGMSTAALCLPLPTIGWKSHHMNLGIMLNPLQHSPLPCSSHTSFKTCGLWLTARGSLWAVSGGIILNFKWHFMGIFSFFRDAVLHSTLSIPEINNWSREF